MLITQKLTTSGSFKAISKSFIISNFYLSLKTRTPTHTTIINWIHKIGYYELKKEKEKADDWIILLDHSIQIGKEKIFVVLGIRESKIDFSRPLKYQDLVPLLEISKETWNGEIISEYLINLKDEIGDIKYAVGDYGSDIKKGLRLAKVKHIHDVTHAIALILERLYKNDNEYQQFTEDMSKMRIKFSQTKYAYIIPPKQRKKSRYQNIKTISNWGMNALNFLDKVIKKTKEKEKDEKKAVLNKEAKEKLKWIKKYKLLIQELSGMNEIISEIEKIIKSTGICKLSVKKCNQLLKKLISKKGIELKRQLNDYFKSSEYLLRATKNILCTSDILESAFGKYKNYVSNNPMAGITNLILCIAAFTSSLTDDDIKRALEETKKNDIKNWTIKNIGSTIFQQRKEAFSPG